MGQVDNPQVNAPKTKVTLTEDVWRMAKDFVAQENARSPIHKVSLRGVVNEATREFVANRTVADRAEDEAAEGKAA